MFPFNKSISRIYSSDALASKENYRMIFHGSNTSWSQWCLKPSLYLWTLFSGGVKWASHYPPLCSLHTPAHKLIIDGLFHIDTRTCRTALTAVEEHALMSLLHRQIHWGMGDKHQEQMKLDISNQVVKRTHFTGSDWTIKNVYRT